MTCGLGRAVLVAAAVALAGCGGDDSDDGETGERQPSGALGSGSKTALLGRDQLAGDPGRVAWLAHEIRLARAESIEHQHEFAFVYAHRASAAIDGKRLAEGEGAPVAAGTRHTHAAADGAAVLWEIRLARPGAGAPPGVRGARRVFESEPLEGIQPDAIASFLRVTVPARGGMTTVHTHPGPEFIYQLSGQIDYQNAIVGTRRMRPGDAEGIPPNTAVQKRNPLAADGVFLSWFLVDPDKPFAPLAEF
jgi:quercetin dioxygenase-like cupin family protein